MLSLRDVYKACELQIAGCLVGFFRALNAPGARLHQLHARIVNRRLSRPTQKTWDNNCFGYVKRPQAFLGPVQLHFQCFAEIPRKVLRAPATTLCCI